MLWFDDELDHLLALGDVSKVPIAALDHLRRAVPELASDLPQRDRRAVHERLEPRRCVGVTKGVEPWLVRRLRW